MSEWIIPPVPGLIEAAVAPEFVIDGIGAVELLQGSVRFYVYQDQLSLDASAIIPQRVVVYKSIAPIGILPTSIGKLAQCLVGIDPASHQVGPWPRLVK